MEYTRDVIAEWPNFTDQPISGPVASLHVSDRELEVRAWSMISDRPLPGELYLAVFLATEADTPFHRARSFWKQHRDIASLGQRWEQSHVEGNTIRRVALLELEDSERIRDALFSAAVPSRQRVVVMTRDSIDVDAFASALASDPALSEVHFQPRGLVPWLLRAGLSLGVVVVHPEDGPHGSPGLGFYGSGEQIARLRDAASLAPPTAEM